MVGDGEGVDWERNGIHSQSSLDGRSRLQPLHSTLLESLGRPRSINLFHCELM